jgi:uncharacterized protein (DUF58 family)
VASAQPTFALVPRARLIGLPFGTLHSARRGRGSDVAGSRPYRPGDDVHAIDWAASAKLSAAQGQDVFIVRERYADEAPYVICVCDRRPEMAHMAPPLPWLSKPAAMEASLDLIHRAAAHARAFVGYLDFANGEPFWRTPASARATGWIEPMRETSDTYLAPANTLALALTQLAEHHHVLPAGSFVFLLSDFLEPPREHDWRSALERRWDVVPVVIQDPVWEQSFPDVEGIAVPFVDPVTNRLTYVRLTGDEVAERRERNERRLHDVLSRLRDLGLDPILVSSDEPAEVRPSFAAWTEHRLLRQGRGW